MVLSLVQRVKALSITTLLVLGSPSAFALGAFSEVIFRVQNFPDVEQLQWSPDGDPEDIIYRDAGVICDAQTIFGKPLWVSSCRWIWYIDSDESYLETDYATLQYAAEMVGEDFDYDSPESAVSFLDKHSGAIVCFLMLMVAAIGAAIKFGVTAIKSRIDPKRNMWAANLFKIRSDKAEWIALGLQTISGTGHLWLGQTGKGWLSFLLWCLAVFAPGANWVTTLIALFFMFDAFVMGGKLKRDEKIWDWQYVWKTHVPPKIEPGLPDKITIKGVGVAKLMIGGGIYKLGFFSCNLSDIIAFETDAGVAGRVGQAVMSVVDLVQDDGDLGPDLEGAARDEMAGRSTILKGITPVLKEKTKKGTHKRAERGRLMYNQFKNRDNWQRILECIEALDLPVVEKFDG